MSENPLLPDAELRALLALTRHVIALEATTAVPTPERPSARSSPAEPQKGAASRVPATAKRPARATKTQASRGATVRTVAREAALAATTMQLKAGDLLVGAASDRTLLALSPKSPANNGRSSSPALLPAQFTKGISRLILATTLASALRSLQSQGVVLAFTRSGQRESDWPQALAWAQAELLPLILVCLDPSGPAAFSAGRSPVDGQFVWSGVARTAARLKLPVLTVDGEDAVAMYRTAQEAILRARGGGGPALLWASLSAPAAASARLPAQRPLIRLTRYMRARKIALS